MASSKLRSSSCSFLNLLLSFLNFILFVLSAASLAPTLLLRMPPTSLGWAFLTISAVSLLSSFVGFYSHLTRFCHVTHLSLLLASSASQLLGILALFTREKSSLSMLGSPREAREAKFLVRLECGALMAMFVVQVGVLIVCCAVQRWWVREYEGLEATARKRRQRIASVQEESMMMGSHGGEMKGKRLDEKMTVKNNKYAASVVDDEV